MGSGPLARGSTGNPLRGQRNNHRTGGCGNTHGLHAFCTLYRDDCRDRLGGVNGARRMDHESCVACDFDGSLFDARQLLDAIRALGPEWSTLLSNAGDDLRVRPAPETWSAIEYAAHSRDITALHVFGVDQALRLDEPVIPEIAADELIEEASATYATADPGLVASELGDQARLLADLAEAAGPASWTRGITIGDSRRDVRSLLEHALHDSHHHLVDVEDGLSVLRARTR
jgi:hypothetical protein